MYGSQLWGNASNSNIDIVLTITGAPWYENIHRVLNVLPVKEVIEAQKEKYFTMLSLYQVPRLSNQPVSVAMTYPPSH